MNIKRRAQRAYLYRSIWMPRSDSLTHGYAKQEYLGSISVDALSVPEHLKEILTADEVMQLEMRILAPSREAMQRKHQNDALRESDPLWRIEEARRLLAEAAERSRVHCVPGGHVETVLAELTRINRIDVQRSPSGASREEDSLSDALHAVRRAAQAVRGGAYGHAPAEGVRSTLTYRQWAELYDAVVGDRGSLMRALQDAGFAKSRKS